MSKELRDNYCFWCGAYGDSDSEFCMECGYQIGSYPPEIEALIKRESNKAVIEARIDEQERFVGFLATMHESIPPENQSKVIETWLESETIRLADLKEQIGEE